MKDSRILVVDDEPALRKALASTLSARGFSVDCAESGEEALARLRQQKIDLVLLDMNLPGLSGIETCRAMRARSDVAVMMVTVRDRVEDKIQALDAGADGYVTKPFDTNELLARIRAALRRVPSAPPVEPEVLNLQEVEINLRDRRIIVRGRVNRLTPTETKLLGYFVAHPNAILTHDAILGAVWGQDYAEEIEYLRVFVNQLRKKLEPEPAHPKFLVTEPWVGYRFRTDAANAEP